jgi:DNA primase
LPDSNRVVLPVYERSSGVLKFWQARSIDGRQPKYLAPDLDRSRVISQWGHAEAVTLTEDILSAYKVGLVGEGWSLMGTKLTDHALSALMERNKQPGFTVNVWLDNDLPPKHPVNRGQLAAAKVLAKLRAVGLTAHNIISPLDPKLMSRVAIKEYLSNVRIL